MPDDFPRVDVAEHGDVDHVLEQLRKSALQHLRSELKKDNVDSDRSALDAVSKALDGCIASAKARLEPNLSVNGMSFGEGGSQTEPFDQKLSQRVQRLTEEADNLTAEVIGARKTLPARRAAALEARMKVTDQLEDKRETKRRQLEEAYNNMGDTEEKFTLPRAAEIGKTVEAAVQDIESLRITLLEQASAAQEQARFVKRLRIMSASYR